MSRHLSLPIFVICLACADAGVAPAQPPGNEKIVQAIEKGGCTAAESTPVKICRYDYTAAGRQVEALSFQPAGQGPFPAVLMIPGHQRTARDLIALGVRLAGEGFAGVAVTQPGYGKSQGPADFVGPTTIQVLTAGYRKFQREPFVDARRMGIYGYSRGAMAASLLAVQLDDVKAAVFGAGVYDFKKAYDETPLAGIRQNMETETGMTAVAIRQRSSILEMEKLKCPVLILHGEKDGNVPVSQALELRDRLTALGKEFEIKLFPDREHGIGPEVSTLTVDFFRRKLK
ncbi:MAG TPA: prolyl oligopeptidase family serine peptidase [Thermoanaerobaculia bacterium]|nr:prolyl oligopeptidase family serine peptidase [Thermoanaerobaculia bacterium]